MLKRGHIQGRETFVDLLTVYVFLLWIGFDRSSRVGRAAHRKN